MIYLLRQWWIQRQIAAVQRRRDMTVRDFSLAVKTLKDNEDSLEAKLRELRSDYLNSTLAPVKGPK